MDRSNCLRATPSSWRFHFRFSLRTLFILVTIASVGFGTFMARIRGQRRIVDAICNSGGKVIYNSDRQPGSDMSLRAYLADPLVVSFHKANIDGDLITDLAELRHLQRLDLNECVISADALTRLGELQQITQLRLRRTNITDDDMLVVSHLTGLRELVLSGTPITDRGLAKLKSLTNLGVLFIDDTAVTDEGLPELSAACKSL